MAKRAQECFYCFNARVIQIVREDLTLVCYSFMRHKDGVGITLGYLWVISRKKIIF